MKQVVVILILLNVLYGCKIKTADGREIHASYRIIERCLHGVLHYQDNDSRLHLAYTVNKNLISCTDISSNNTRAK